MPRNSAGTTSVTMPVWLVLATITLLSLRVYVLMNEKDEMVKPAERWISPVEYVKVKPKSSDLILLNFSADWCGACKMLDKTTLSNKDVAREINDNFVAVRIDDPSEHMSSTDKLEAHKLESKYEISTFPALVAVLPDGTIVQTKYGFCSVRSMLNFLADAKHRQGYCIARGYLAIGQPATAAKMLDAWIKTANWNDNYAPYAAAFGGIAYKLSGDKASAQSLLKLGDARGKTDFWPQPLIEHELGKISDDELFHKAEDDSRWLTEAKCFVAMDAKASGNTKLYRDTLNWIDANGNRDCFAYRWTRSELQRMAPSRLQTED